MNQKKIGQFIKELRKSKYLTQEQLAEVLGVSSRSISRWENGINMPDFDIVIQLANFFQITIEELLDGEKKEADMNNDKEDAMLKVSDYENEQKLRMIRILIWFFIVGIIASIVSMVMKSQGLASDDFYDVIVGFLDGLVTGVLVFGLIVTFKYMNRIKEYQKRLDKR